MVLTVVVVGAAVVPVVVVLGLAVLVGAAVVVVVLTVGPAQTPHEIKQLLNM